MLGNLQVGWVAGPAGWRVGGWTLYAACLACPGSPRVSLAACHCRCCCPPLPLPTAAACLPACLPGCPPQKHTWTKGLTLRNFEDHSKANERLVGEMQELASEWWWGWWCQ